MLALFELFVQIFSIVSLALLLRFFSLLCLYLNFRIFFVFRLFGFFDTCISMAMSLREKFPLSTDIFKKRHISDVTSDAKQGCALHYLLALNYHKFFLLLFLLFRFTIKK